MKRQNYSTKRPFARSRVRETPGRWALIFSSCRTRRTSLSDQLRPSTACRIKASVSESASTAVLTVLRNKINNLSPQFKIKTTKIETTFSCALAVSPVTISKEMHSNTNNATTRTVTRMSFRCKTSCVSKHPVRDPYREVVYRARGATTM